MVSKAKQKKSRLKQRLKQREKRKWKRRFNNDLEAAVLAASFLGNASLGGPTGPAEGGFAIASKRLDKPLPRSKNRERRARNLLREERAALSGAATDN